MLKLLDPRLGSKLRLVNLVGKKKEKNLLVTPVHMDTPRLPVFGKHPPPTAPRELFNVGQQEAMGGAGSSRPLPYPPR